MAFTVKEETILKLNVQLSEAKAKLAVVNLAMKNEIQAEFKPIDAAIRKNYESQYLPLEAVVATAQAALKTELEKE